MSQAFGAIPIQYGARPPEGARSVQVIFSIIGGAADVYQGSLQQLGLSFVQTIFIDNSLNNSAITISVAYTGQNIEVLAMTQVFVPMLLPAGNFQLTCNGTGTLKVPCQLINVVISPVAYASGSISTVAVSGVVPVTVQNFPVTQQVSFVEPVGVTQSTSPWVISGTATVAQGSPPWSVSQSGTWNVGITGSVAVTGTFWQATQPVSVAATLNVLQATNAATWNDHSVALTGSSATAIASNASRKNIWLQLSNSAPIGSIAYVSITANNAVTGPSAGNQSFELQPGDSASLTSYPQIGTAAVKVIGNSIGVGAFLMAWELV